MIRMLRKKFVLINMLFVFVILLIVFTVFGYTNLKRQQQESRNVLKMALERPDNQMPPKYIVGQKPPMGEFNRVPVFVVRVGHDQSPAMIMGENVDVSDEELYNIVRQVMALEQEQGVLKQYALRFRRHEFHDGVKIAFMDMTQEFASTKRIILTSVASGASAMLAFLIVSLYLSSWALRPVEKAWQQQQQFVADASHELKTPLTIILTNVGIIKSHPNDTVASQMQWVKNTDTEGKRMKRLIDDLLFLAKTDNVTQQRVYHKVNFSDICFSAALTFESVAYEQGIALEPLVDPDVFVLGDAVMLSQLCTILLDNAVKHSDKGAPVTMRLYTKLSKTPDYVKLSVHNQGTVIDSEDLPHLFERFYRSDKSRTAQGYGLGLSIAQNIVERHNGSITVKSTAEGTIFTAVLPVYQ